MVLITSSEDVTWAMRGQLKRLSRNDLRQNGGNVVKSHFICFDFQDVLWHRCFLHSQPSFCWAGLSLALCLFGGSFFRYSLGFRELNRETTTATETCLLIKATFTWTELSLQSMQYSKSCMGALFQPHSFREISFFKSHDVTFRNI